MGKDLATGEGSSLYAQWIKMFRSAGLEIDELYRNRIDALKQVVRDPSHDHASLEAEYAKVKKVAAEINDDLLAKLELK